MESRWRPPGRAIMFIPICSNACPQRSGPWKDRPKVGLWERRYQSLSSHIWARRIQSRCDRRSSGLPLLWSPHTGKAGLRSDLLPKSLAYSNPLQPFPLSYCQIFTRFGVWRTQGHTGQQRLYRTYAYWKSSQMHSTSGDVISPDSKWTAQGVTQGFSDRRPLSRDRVDLRKGFLSLSRTTSWDRLFPIRPRR